MLRMIPILFMLIQGNLFSVQEAPTTAPSPTEPDIVDVEYWYGGNLIHAHNYLAGGVFYDMDAFTVFLADGTNQDFEVVSRSAIMEADWETYLIEHSSLDTLTFVTCYPRNGMTSWRLVVEAKPVGDFYAGEVELEQENSR